MIKSIDSKLTNINKGIVSTRTDFSRTAAKLAIKIQKSGKSVPANVNDVLNKIVRQKGILRGNMSTLQNNYVNQTPVINMPKIIKKLEDIVTTINTNTRAKAASAAEAAAQNKRNANALAKKVAENKNRKNILNLQSKTQQRLNETQRALFGKVNRNAATGRTPKPSEVALNSALERATGGNLRTLPASRGGATASPVESTASA